MSVFRFILVASSIFLASCELSTLAGSNVPYANFELQWQAPMTRENGDPLKPAELAAYELVYRAQGNRFFEHYKRIDGSKTSIRVTDIPVGLYEFRIAAIDSNGLYSNYSESTVVDANESGSQTLTKSVP